MIVCAGCGLGTGGHTFACCGRGWCRPCYEPHLKHHVLATAARREGAGLRGLDLAELESEMLARHRGRRPRSAWWPMETPTPWLIAGVLGWGTWWWLAGARWVAELLVRWGLV